MCGLMPILRSALAMDEENYLHPEGPQLDSSLFSVASSNMEVLYCIYFSINLYVPFTEVCLLFFSLVTVNILRKSSTG